MRREWKENANQLHSCFIEMMISAKNHYYLSGAALQSHNMPTGCFIYNQHRKKIGSIITMDNSGGVYLVGLSAH